MPRTAALGVVDQETRIALLSLQKRLAVLEKGAFDGRKNLLDNGQFEVNQRALTSASLGSVILADRWHAANNGVGVLIAQWLTPAGFGGPSFPSARPTPYHVQRMYVSTGEAAASLSAADYLVYYQAMEGLNLQHLNWGLPNARPVVLSFDVYSSVAGTYAAELLSSQAAGARSITRLFTVVAGAWQTVKLAFPGDTVFSIDNDTTGRLLVQFFVSAGSTYTSGTLQSNWGTVTNGNRAVGIDNAWQATAGNSWAITNVQLEVGTSATPYEVRSFPDELRTCQRYFWQTPLGANYPIIGVGETLTATTGVASVRAAVPMRAIPSIATVGNLRLIDQFGASGYAVTSIALTGSGQSTSETVYLDVACSGGGMTGGRFVHLQGNADTTATFRLNAEI